MESSVFKKQVAAMHRLNQPLTLTRLLVLAVLGSAAGCGNSKNAYEPTGAALPSGNPTDVTAPASPLTSDGSIIISSEYGGTRVVESSKSPKD